MLINLRNAAAAFRPIVDFVQVGKPKEEIKKERLDTWNSSFNAVAKTFDYNKPFYSLEIYKEIENVLKISRNEAVDYSVLEEGGRGYWEQGEKNIKQIGESIDTILTLIRKRIEFVEVS